MNRWENLSNLKGGPFYPKRLGTTGMDRMVMFFLSHPPNIVVELLTLLHHESSGSHGTEYEHHIFPIFPGAAYSSP
jgi:hypothetical protein